MTSDRLRGHWGLTTNRTHLVEKWGYVIGGAMRESVSIKDAASTGRSRGELLRGESIMALQTRRKRRLKELAVDWLNLSATIIVRNKESSTQSFPFVSCTIGKGRGCWVGKYVAALGLPNLPPLTMGRDVYHEWLQRQSLLYLTRRG